MKTEKQNELTKKSLFGYLATVGLDAFNDNAYKITLSMLLLAKFLPTQGGSLLISAASAVYIIPFLLFSSLSGSLSDRYSKREVLVWSKVGEIVVMSIGTVGFVTDNIPTLFFALFLMGVQSAILSPAKFGIIPELVGKDGIAKMNGHVEAVTFLSIVSGTAAGAMLIPALGDQWVGLFFVAISTIATLTSLTIPFVPAGDPTRPISPNPFGDVVRTLRGVLRRPGVAAPLAGLSWFWFFGAFLQMSILLFSKQTIHAGDTATGLLLTALALSIGLGALLAGRWSAQKIEIGLIPLGAIGMAVFTLGLSLTNSLPWAAACLSFLGLFGGLFIIPLDALVQRQSDPTERGRILAASNFLVFSGILLSSGFFTLITDVAGASPRWAIGIIGMAALAVAAYLTYRLAVAFVRFIFWLATHAVFDIRIHGAQNIPHRGPAILAVNHVSFLDMCLIGACMQRAIRFLMLREYFEIPWFKPVCRVMNAIPFKPGNGPEALDIAAGELKDGKVVCIFPEGQISRNGQILTFRRGIEILAEKTNVPIIPVHIDGMRGGPFTENSTGKMFWFPRRFPWHVSISFGQPLPPDAAAAEVRAAVVELSSNALAMRSFVRSTLAERFIESAAKYWGRTAVADSTGRVLSYGKLLTAGFMMKKIITREIHTEKVGMMIPSSVGAALANLAVTLAGKTAVNINFTTSECLMRHAAEKCRMTHVITSRAFLEKTGITPPATPIYLEDIGADMSKVRMSLMYVTLRLLPLALMKQWMAPRVRPDDVAAILFSSGSTGDPKGVMLSHANVLSNVASMTDVFHEQTGDTILGVLPFFHSFGWTGTLWYPLLRGSTSIYHPNPADSRTIAKLAKRHNATFMVSTPTFCRMYLRNIPPEYFSSLRTLIVGAEPLAMDLARQLEETYGVSVLEGYGATECSPVVSVNLPEVRISGVRQRGTKHGSVGRPVPGVAVKLVDPETMMEVPAGKDGLLLVRGPNVMKGYWQDEQATMRVMRDGWYITGDMATLDDDGFIRIVGRLSRFSKIGGEMVPHILIEQRLQELSGRPDSQFCVTAVGDDRKGERLVVLYREFDDVAGLWAKLNASDMPKLWIPAPNRFHRVAELPVLGSGKLDMRKIRILADERERAA